MNLPPEYVIAMYDLSAQLGVRGASVLFASGDDGVGNGDLQGQPWKRPQFPRILVSQVPELTYQRRQHDELQPRGSGRPLHGRPLVLLSAAELPG